MDYCALDVEALQKDVQAAIVAMKVDGEKLR
jgi:hypothetical protein